METSKHEQRSFVTLVDSNSIIVVSPVNPPPRPTRNTSRNSNNNNNRVLSWLGVTAIATVFSSTGTFTADELVDAAGPVGTFGALTLYPLLVTIPYAVIIAELCCAFPEDGGFAVWVVNAFGPFWGFQVGYWSWVAAIIASGLMPRVILDMMYDALGRSKLDSFSEHVAYFAILVGLTVTALAKSRLIGAVSIIALVMLAAAIVVVTFCSYAHLENLGKTFEAKPSVTPSGVPVDAVDYVAVINVMFWNFDGINMISVFGGEIKNPAHTYPKAITATVALVMASFLLPVPAMLAARDVDWFSFRTEGYMGTLVRVGGPTLQAFVVTISIAVAVVQFVCGVYVESYQLCGMAENGLIPPMVGKRNKILGSPHFAVLTIFVGALPMLFVEPKSTLPVSNMLSCAIQVLIMAAAVQLRRKFPYAPRPVKIPGEEFSIMLLSVFPVSILANTIMCTFEKGVLLKTLAFFAPGIFAGLYRFHWKCHQPQV